MKYQMGPHLLREELLAKPRSPSTTKFEPIIVDEIQKVPALLDEVHWLIENAGQHFALCGSSARKLRRGHANLLGGRALRFELLGLTSLELGKDFDLLKMTNRGYLPAIYAREDFRAAQRSYCADYLKEEIAAEGLTRNLPAFAHFLEAAALSDTETVNFATIARDTGVSAPTVKSHFELLVDTLIGSFLPAYRARPKRRVVVSPKFYFGDVGVVNHLVRRGNIEPGSELFGKAFENWLHHELRAFQAYREPDLDFAFWRLSSGVEVDFILGKMVCAIEAKATARITSDHLKGLRVLKEDYPTIKRRLVVSLEKTPRRTEDGIEILPYRNFLEELWAGDLAQ